MGPILAVDAAVALRSAALNVPDPKPFRDGLIAATALVHSRLVVDARNLADFEATGVPLLIPWRRGRADQPRWRPTPEHAAHRASAVPVGLEGLLAALWAGAEECCQFASGEGIIRLLPAE